jgi:hypothetical protein
MARGRAIVVFSIVQPSACDECGAELHPGNLLHKRDAKALCLGCADLDHLVCLQAGNAALTRRSTTYSRLHAVIVRWSRARKRYERQGVLVEEQALQRAEQECLTDAEQRAARRRRDAIRRERLDTVFVEQFAAAVRGRYPACPANEAQQIAEHACARHSGRVGRTAAAKAFAVGAVELAVVAHVRHGFTPYDELLAAGCERAEAREEVRPAVDAVRRRWAG